MRRAALRGWRIIGTVSRPRTRLWALGLLAFGATALALCAPGAHAAEYKMLGCSGEAHDPFYTISTNTTSPQSPAGIFSFWNYCSGQGFDPPGNDAFLRINENQPGGYARNGAYLSFNFDTPNQFIHFRSAGGYTREPNAFNDGWRARLLISGGSAGARELMSQGKGLCNCGDQWATTSTFAPHLWPVGGYLDFTRFTFEMVCLRYGGCDRANYNAADLNGMVFVLSDEYPSQVNLTETNAPFLGGQWVRGNQAITYNWTEIGSGMKLERVYVDGAVRGEVNHGCKVGHSSANGEYALTYEPCDVATDVKRSVPIDTASLSDGAHTVTVCTQDYAQWGNLNGSGGQTCDSRTVRTDNTRPGKPAVLEVTSADPARYEDRFGARFSLPADPGSPIARVHYEVLNSAGQVVVPERTVAAQNPTSLPDLEGPAQPGAYHLRLWLEDSVGLQGPAAEAPIPHDTVPPAAPQDLHVTGPSTSHWVKGLDLDWRNLADGGSPITTAHYQVLNEAGNVVVATQSSSAANIEALAEMPTPPERCACTARVWLEDAEGNVGAAASVPLPIDTTPPAAPQELHVVGQTSHWTPSVDLAWRDLTDGGAPVATARYQVIDAAGKPVGPAQSVAATNVQAISGLQTPAQRAHYKVQVWLEDAEGNVGAASAVALPIDTTPPAAPQGLTVTPPSASRASDGFDVRWRDVADAGAPIDAAHYQVLDGGGKVVVGTQTVKGSGIDSIAELDAPQDPGTYTLRLWLEDAEGNVGVAATAPLAYDCVRSHASGGSGLSAGLGDKGVGDEVLRQGKGTTLSGRLTSAGGGAVANAPICVFSRVVTERAREFLGLAVTGSDGSYRFAIPAGASRELSVLYRSGQRQVGAGASVETIARPAFKVRRKVVRNKHFAHFVGHLAGPDNDNVVIVLQVRRGKGWLAFRRYRTRAGGWFRVGYRFNRTPIPTKYVMRAQVRTQAGYPYRQGNSRRLKLIVLPRRLHARHGRRGARH